MSKRVVFMTVMDGAPDILDYKEWCFKTWNWWCKSHEAIDSDVTHNWCSSASAGTDQQFMLGDRRVSGEDGLKIKTRLLGNDNYWQSYSLPFLHLYCMNVF